MPQAGMAWRECAPLLHAGRWDRERDRGMHFLRRAPASLHEHREHGFWRQVSGWQGTRQVSGWQGGSS